MAEKAQQITLKDHLRKHADVYDPKLNRHEKILVGEDGDDGLTRSFAVVQENYVNIKKDVATVKALEWGIIATLIGTILVGFIK